MRIRKLTAQLIAIAVMTLIMYVLSVAWMTYLREYAYGDGVLQGEIKVMCEME